MLKPGEAQQVSFRLTIAELSFVRAECLSKPERIWEPGKFVIGIGPASDALSAAEVEWLAGD